MPIPNRDYWIASAIRLVVGSLLAGSLIDPFEWRSNSPLLSTTTSSSSFSGLDDPLLVVPYTIFEAPWSPTMTAAATTTTSTTWVSIVTTTVTSFISSMAAPTTTAATITSSNPSNASTAALALALLWSMASGWLLTSTIAFVGLLLRADPAAPLSWVDMLLVSMSLRKDPRVEQQAEARTDAMCSIMNRLLEAREGEDEDNERRFKDLEAKLAEKTDHIKILLDGQQETSRQIFELIGMVAPTLKKVNSLEGAVAAIMIDALNAKLNGQEEKEETVKGGKDDEDDQGKGAVGVEEEKVEAKEAPEPLAKTEDAKEVVEEDENDEEARKFAPLRSRKVPLVPAFSTGGTTFFEAPPVVFLAPGEKAEGKKKAKE